MKRTLFFTSITILLSISGFSQIEMGKIEKATGNETKVSFPVYDNSENFIIQSEYYKAKITKILESGNGKNPFAEKQCDENEYYNYRKVAREKNRYYALSKWRITIVIKIRWYRGI